MKHGFIKVAAGTTDVRVADCAYNLEQMKAITDEAAAEGVSVLVLPELCITAYTCQDLFFQQTLLDGAMSALKEYTEYTAKYDMLTAVVYIWTYTICYNKWCR